MFPAKKETGTNFYPAQINRSSNARLVPLTLVPMDSKSINWRIDHEQAAKD
jgi:hypothetical protein